MSDRADHSAGTPHLDSGDWICVVCGKKVAESQHDTPDECPRCDGPSDGTRAKYGRVA